MAKKKKEGGFWADFKKFISRGNVVDMAVAVVVGGAFGKIVTGFVNFIINPFIGLFMENGDLSSWKTVINEAVIDPVTQKVITPEAAFLWGSWVQTIIDFLIIALCIFAVIKIIGSINKRVKAKEIAEKAEADRIAAEKAEEEKKLAEEAANKKAEEEKALRESLMAQEQLLKGILAELKNK